jgi:sugar phosphate permease
MSNGTAVANAIKPPTSKRNYVFFVCCLMQAVVWTDEFTFSTLTPYWSEHFGFDAIQISSISSGYLLGYFPMLLVGGLLADKFGAKRMMLICVAGCGILSLMMLLCTDYTSMYWRNLIFGIFFGMNWAPCNKMMANWLPAHERGTKVSIWSTLCTACQLYTAPMALLIAARLQWQLAFVVVTIMAVPLFIMILFTQNEPSKMKKISKEEVDYINAGRDEEALKNENFNFRLLGEIFKDRNCWVVSIAVVLASAPTWMAATWGSMTLIDGFGLSAESAAALISPMSLIPVAISFTVGWVITKMFKGNIKYVFVLSPIIGAICYITSATVVTSPLVMAVLVFGIANGANAWGFGGCNAYFAAYSRPALWGTLNGLAPCMQTGFGFILVQLSGRWVTEGASMGGYGNVFMYAGFIWLLGIVFGLLAKKRLITDTYETVR